MLEELIIEHTTDTTALAQYFKIKILAHRIVIDDELLKLKPVGIDPVNFYEDILNRFISATETQGLKDNERMISYYQDKIKAIAFKHLGLYTLLFLNGENEKKLHTFINAIQPIWKEEDLCKKRK